MVPSNFSFFCSIAFFSFITTALGGSRLLPSPVFEVPAVHKPCKARWNTWHGWLHRDERDLEPGEPTHFELDYESFKVLNTVLL